jgi:hypothetical protein
VDWDEFFCGLYSGFDGSLMGKKKIPTLYTC